MPINVIITKKSTLNKILMAEVLVVSGGDCRWWVVGDEGLGRWDFEKSKDILSVSDKH